jgi:hypothetical protein
MDVTVRFELHNEIVSLAIYIHAKGTNHTDDIANNIIDSFANLRSIIDGAKSRRSLYDVHSFLYDDVWSQFFADKQNKRLNPNEHFSFDPEIDDAELIADVRGLILVSESFIDSSHAVSALQPFLCCNKIPSLDNYTISTMMNEKAMHVSTIARPDKTNPYFMVCANSSSINSRDLGKLVETGHRLIISRLAAIRSARNFTDVSNVIRKIAAECSCIRRSFSENVPIEQIKQRMTDTSTMFSLLEKLCVGDPNNRLRMVEKHKTEFDSNRRELQIASIGTYKQFDKYTAGVLLLKVRWAHKLLHKYNSALSNM